jgi:hypothetical protein
MKTYKRYSKIFLTIVGVLFLFAACEKDIQDRESSPVMPENCQGVYFPSTNPSVVELEPSQPTQFSITIARTDSVSAAEVPITVETNTNNVFVVPEKAVFAANAKETTLTITFPKAAEGITYELKLSVSGDEYVSKYASTIPYVSANVTRIKWETQDDPFVYVDGTISFLYGIAQRPMYVVVEKATLSDAVRYRFKNAFRVATPGVWVNGNEDYIPEADEYDIYNGYPYNWPGDVDESKDYYIILEIDKAKNVSMVPTELGVIWSYGMMSIGSIYGYLSPNIASYPLGIYEEGENGDVITFPAKSLYISMENLNNGGVYVSEVPTIIYTTRDAYLAANMKIDDFNDVEYEEIKGSVSEFESAAYSENWSQSIYKAIDIDEENEESEYKNLYYLANLYEDNYGLAFYYNGRTVSIPAGQNTGRQAFGKDVYVSQSESIESSVITNSKGVEIYTLGLKFHFKDGTVVGEFAETFYYSKDAVAYDERFIGDFTLTSKNVFDDTDAEMSVTIDVGTEPNTLIITGIDLAESVTATVNPLWDILTIEPQVLADYGPYDMTLYTYTSSGSASGSASMSFTFNMAGQLVLTSNSEAIGYLLRSAAGGGWIDGYYDLLFTRQAAAGTSSDGISSSVRTSSSVQSAVIKPENKSFNVLSATKTQKGSTGNFAIKGTAKTIKKGNLIPLF